MLCNVIILFLLKEKGHLQNLDPCTVVGVTYTVFSFGGLYYVNLLLTSQLFNIIYLCDIGMTLLILYDCHSCTQKSKWYLES